MTTATAGPRTSNPYFLPLGYQEQVRNLSLDVNRDNGTYWADWRLADSARFQVHVYRWAASMIRERHAATGRGVSVLDVGCGVGTKLGAHIAPVAAEIHAIDQASALAHVATRCHAAVRHEADLETSEVRLGRTFDLILCADVIEHLVDPDPMLEMIRSHARRGARRPGASTPAQSLPTMVLFSTPERRRLRGRNCNASNKPEHVREWSMDEFCRLLSSRGFTGLRSRLFPQDNADPAGYRAEEIEFRLGKGEKSRLACHAVLCRVG